MGEVDLGDPARGGLKAVPVTEGGVLFDLAREMRNCLASYAPRCVEGGTRIFAFYATEEESGRKPEAGRMRLAGAGEAQARRERLP